MYIFIYLSISISLSLYKHLYVNMCAPDSCRRSPPKIGKGKTSLVSVDSFRGSLPFAPTPPLPLSPPYLSRFLYTLSLFVYIYTFIHLHI